MVSQHGFAYKRPPFPVAYRMKKTVLLVDRDEDSRVVYQTMLSHAGYHVVVAIDGEEGVALARSHTPDVLVTELALTKRSGLDLIRLLRKEPSLGRTRIVVLTASGTDADQAEAARLGCSLFLSKPVEPKTLLDMVDHLTASAQPAQ